MKPLQWGSVRELPNPIDKVMSDTQRVLDQVIEIKNKELIKSVEEQQRRNF